MLFKKTINKKNKPDFDAPIVFRYAPNQCGNCHERLKDDDMYCRYCGTKRGEGKFLPYYNVMQCIYGPMPEKRVHICESCHFRWETEMMIDDQKYCPICGNLAPISDNAYPTPLIKVFVEVNGQCISLKSFPFILGRDQNANYRDPDPTVSRKHAKITLENNLVFITDLGSTNGTILNDKHLAPFKSEPIVDSDRIKIGKSAQIYKVRIIIN